MRVLAVSSFAAIVACGGAYAQDSAPRDGAYIRLGAGVTLVKDWDQDLAFNPDLVFVSAPPTGQRVANSEGFLAAAALGFNYADGIRTELEYRYASSKIDSVTLETPVIGPTVIPTANDDVNVHFLMSNFYFDFTNNSRLTPFIGGGVGGAFVENETGDRDAALAYQGRAGVSYDFGDGFAADVEYVFLRTNKLAFGPDAEDFAPAGPFEPAVTGDRYQSSSVMVSLRKQF